MKKVGQSSDIALKVDHISKSFHLPTEKANGIKQAFINRMRGVRGYKKQQVLKDMSFEVKKGDFFGIVGRNGSGKSTLLKLISQIYTPDSGKITVNGSLVPFIELGVGFNPELTGRENVYLNGAMLGFSRDEIDVMYDEIVEFAELGEFMDQKLKNYSSGMQVRLAFSVAIKAQGTILVLDEVLAVGDAAFQQKCFDYFGQLKEMHQTVILVTHDMSSVQRFCNRAIYIKEGKIICDGNSAEIAKLYMEENFTEVAPSQDEPQDERTDSLNSLSVAAKREGTVVYLKFTYNAMDDDEKYIGFSLYRDGVISAEMNSLKHSKAGQSGSLVYKLDTDALNPGPYEIDAVVFGKKNRNIIALAKKRAKFLVPGVDETRGASIKLPDSWAVEHKK